MTPTPMGEKLTKLLPHDLLEMKIKIVSVQGEQITYLYWYIKDRVEFEFEIELAKPS